MQPRHVYVLLKFPSHQESHDLGVLTYPEAISRIDDMISNVDTLKVSSKLIAGDMHIEVIVSAKDNVGALHMLEQQRGY